MKQTKTKDEKFTLEVTDRKIFGKKLKKLRTEGVIPANIYGPKFKSKAISVPYKEFLATYKKAKETGIVYIKVDGAEVPTLIKNLQKHPLANTLLHVDFRKIDLSQKIETEVPIRLVGESEAVEQKGGVLLNQSDHLLVEALPADIPTEIEIDISILKEVGTDIKVSDLTKSAKYEVKEEPDKIIVSVTAHKEESLTPETTAETPEVITEAPKEGEDGAPLEASAPEGKQAAAKADEDKGDQGKAKEADTKNEKS